MKRICHAHCPSPGGNVWMMLAGVVAGIAVVTGIAHVLIAIGKTAMTVIAATVAVLVITFIVFAVRGAVRNLRGEPAPVTDPQSAAKPMKPTPIEQPPVVPAPTSPMSGRPRLRLIRGGRAA
ncbi:hypothetical protein ABN028_34020 [Actinopolymorpha sp. B17G11]|uniref:hypothetical protein n=1 Tax=Actinopolymorpha sp. B17G11 TaxID=3160861 RepID=UPI0032E514E9